MSAQTAVNAPILPDASVHLVRPDAPAVGTVVSTQRCVKSKSSSFIRHIEIDISGTALAGKLLAGQSFGVIPPSTDARRRPHRPRLYSLACPSWGEDGAGCVISTTPKRVIDERKPQRPGDDPEDHSLFLGLCSNYLCDLRVGAEVLLTGPSGKNFLLPVNPGDHDFLFLATGTGIAPFRGMVMELLDHPDGPQSSCIHLVSSSPYTNDLIYEETFGAYAAAHENFHYHTAVTREAGPAGRPGVYVHDLIDQKMDEVFGPLLESPRTLIYICGLAGMQFGLFRLLSRHGLGGAFLNIRDDELAAMDSRDWPVERMRRGVRPTRRCLIEVY
jgi:ferredoxin--NADP+ reductase